MSQKKTAARESAAPADPPRETHPIARGPMDTLDDAMILNSHVDSEGRPMHFEAAEDGALVRTYIPERRAADQDAALEDAFIEGSLPEDERRRSSPPSDPEE